jgi:uncharacterized integral membrane protein
MRTYLKAIVLVVVLLFLTTFGIKNNHPLQLYYYFNIETLRIPLYGVVYISIIIGIVIGMLVGISARFSLSGKVKALQKEINELQEKAVEERKEEDPQAPLR